MSDIYSDEFPSDRADGWQAFSPAVSRAAGAALFLILVAGMAVWAYRLGTRDAMEVPIIRAMEDPARVQPDDPSGVIAAHQGLEVNSVLAGTAAPVPAADEAAALVRPEVTLQPEDGPQGELMLARPEIPPMTIATDADLRMPPAEDAGPELAATDPTLSQPGNEVAALIEAALRGAEASAGAEEDAATALAAGPRPRGRPAGFAASRPTAMAPSPQALPPASPAPTSAAAAREVARVDAGDRLVQLGAFDSEGLARQVWNQLTQAHGDLLGSKSLFLERATHNARVFYRLRVAGFSTADETRVICERLRGRGVDCIPVQMY